jgi:hypothetical protein
MRSNQKIIAILFLAFLILQTACVDEISFDSDVNAGLLVVEGSIHNGPPPYYLRLGQTSAEQNVPVPLENADIVLYDSEGNSERFVDDSKGVYKLHGEIIQGTNGKYYHVEIELPDGRTFHSIPEKIPDQTASGAVRAVPARIQEETASGGMRWVNVVHVFAETDFPESQEEQYYKTQVEGVYMFREEFPASSLAPPPQVCYVTEYPEPQRINLISLQPDTPAAFPERLITVKRIRGHEFFYRYYFNLVFYSISERRFRYWEQTNTLINQSGTIFDIAPAIINGNVINTDSSQENALGYFQAAATDTVRTFLTRSDFRFGVIDPCAPNNPVRHSGCSNCTSIENSTLDRPSYF